MATLFLNKNLANKETTNKSAEIRKIILEASVPQRLKPPNPYIPVNIAIVKNGSVRRFMILLFKFITDVKVRRYFFDLCQ